MYVEALRGLTLLLALAVMLLSAREAQQRHRGRAPGDPWVPLAVVLLAGHTILVL